MTKFFTPALLVVFSALTLSLPATAADRLVARNGAGGAYATIQAAVDAAADNDRIVVTPDVVPFGENLTITKSLTFVSNTEGTLFTCAGTWTFNPSAAGKRLTIVGLRLLSGNITTGISAPAGTRSRIEILHSVLRSGNVEFFSYNNYDLTVAADSIRGQVRFRFGRVIGNYLDVSNGAGNAVYTTNDAIATNDSIMVVGNRIRGASGNSWAIALSNNSQYVYCANNFLIINYNNNYSDYGIYCDGWKTGTGTNSIVNNTIYNAGSQGDAFCCTRYAIQLYAPQVNTQVVGNVVQGVSASAGVAIAQTNGGVNNYVFAYNYTKGFTISVSVANNGTNKSGNSTTVINATTGAVTGDAVNGNDPDAEFTDIDLSRGDAGAYGGSYTLANFHPFVSATPAANTARVTLVRAKRRILQGGSVKVQATGFDR